MFKDFHDVLCRMEKHQRHKECLKVLQTPRQIKNAIYPHFHRQFLTFVAPIVGRIDFLQMARDRRLCAVNAQFPAELQSQESQKSFCKQIYLHNSPFCDPSVIAECYLEFRRVARVKFMISKQFWTEIADFPADLAAGVLRELNALHFWLYFGLF